jgi:phosphotransferase system enzyme I (PtsI)
MILKGTPVSPGFASGSARALVARKLAIPRYVVPEKEREAEAERLCLAIEATTKELESAKEALRGKVEPSLLDLFDAYAVILKDPALLRAARFQISKEGSNAEQALESAIKAMTTALMASQDSYFQEKASDLEDLYSRVQRHLRGAQQETVAPSAEPQVILADNLTPSETGHLHQASVVAFATEHGARTSHTAIIARSLGIPAVVGVAGLMAAAATDQRVIVDGVEGKVILDPTPEEEAEYAKRAEAYRDYRRKIKAGALKEARTIDGHVIRTRANIDLENELQGAIEAGAEGVGLYRSEFLYLERSPNLPTEDDHAALYNRICEALYPHRVTIRTLDLGGEKYFHEVLEPEGQNPVLGVRAVRFTLRHPDIFKVQLRGLLRASARKNIAIMFPLVTTVDELKACISLLNECKAELKAEGVAFDHRIPVGIMVEVPSCALTAEAFLPYTDFFSIGTNDLIQYLMAIDRNNESVAPLYDPMNPAVLRCISHVCESARVKGIPVAVCGEMASDALMAPLLVGLGVTELSMAPEALLDVKAAVRGISYEKCRRMARHALKAGTGAEVAEILESYSRTGRHGR